MNRVSHICGFWFIFLTFCMQRRHVLYNHNVTCQKKRSGLWENKPPSFSPALWWVYCFAWQRLPLCCWALEVCVVSNLKFKPWCEAASNRCFRNRKGENKTDLHWNRLILLLYCFFHFKILKTADFLWSFREIFTLKPQKWKVKKTKKIPQ